MAKNRNRPQSARPHAAVAAQRSRHPLLYVGSLIVLVIITVTFIGTPALGRFAGGSATVFGTYDGIDIEYRRGNYFDRQILSISQQRRSTGGAQDTSAEARAVVREAFQRAAFRTAVLAAAESARLAVSDDLIDAELIRSGPYVVRGVFSEQQYEATPASQRRVNRRLVEEQLLERQYFADLGGVNTSSQAAAFFRGMAATERRFGVASFSFGDLPEEELRTFGAENASLFRRIKLSRILLRSGSGEAEDVLARLRDQSATFEELARLYSEDDIATGGEVGWKYFYDLERDFETAEPVEAVFALAAGEHGDALASRFGDVIYRADTDAVAPDFAAAEVLAAVQDYLSRYRRGVIDDYYSAQAAQFQQQADADGFAAAAAALGVEVVESDFFPVNFQNLIAVRGVRAGDSGVLRAAAYYEEFFKQAFSLEPGQISDPIVLDAQILVLELLEERAAEEPALERVDGYHGYFVAAALDQDLRARVYDPERLVDNFDESYPRFLRGLAAPAQGPPTQAAF